MKLTRAGVCALLWRSGRAAFPRGRGGCAIRPFVPRNESATDLEGKAARLVLPLRVQDNVNEYTLVFTVHNITVVLPES